MRTPSPGFYLSLSLTLVGERKRMRGEGGIRGINICWSYRLGYLVMMMVLVWVFLSFVYSLFLSFTFFAPFLIQLPLNVHIELNVPFFSCIP